jgi:DNA-binding MarR family transcriptional regulator
VRAAAARAAEAALGPAPAKRARDKNRPAQPAGARLSLGELDGLLGFHLRLAQAALYRDFAASLAKLDLTQRQFATLELIRANPGASQAHLAEVLTLDRPAMMAVVDRLEQRGLVLRERSSSDRRRQEIHLTEAGRDLLEQATRRVRRHDGRFLSRFSRADARTLVEWLRRIHGRA